VGDISLEIYIRSHDLPQAITEAQARMELAKDEERRLAAGGELLHATSASSFIVLGLEIEETQ
jgi:hypothetical protein